VYTRRLSRAAQRLLGQLPPETASLYNKSVAGRYAKAIDFDIDVSNASTLWLLVQDEGSNAPEKLRPIWADAELVSAAGAVPLASLTPRDTKGIRHDDSPATGVQVTNPSTLIYDIAGRNFTRFRGRMAIENAVSDIGSTLNPALRFYVFDASPDMDRLIPPSPAVPMPAPPVPRTFDAAIKWVFWYALGRAPTPAEWQLARNTLRQSGNARPSADGLADLLWAVTMTPEFQFIN